MSQMCQKEEGLFKQKTFGYVNLAYSCFAISSSQGAMSAWSWLHSTILHCSYTDCADIALSNQGMAKHACTAGLAQGYTHPQPKKG